MKVSVERFEEMTQAYKNSGISQFSEVTAASRAHMEASKQKQLVNQDREQEIDLSQ